MAIEEPTIPAVLNPTLTIDPETLFEEAADRWMQSRLVQSERASKWSPRYIKPKTEEGYRGDIRSLKLFFTRKRLSDIRLDHLRTYQAVRIDGAAPFFRRRRPHEEPRPCPVKPTRVNQELSLIARILKRAKAWEPALDEYCEPLHEEPSEIPRALSRDDEMRWLEVSLSSQRWWLVHWYSVLALSTCMGTNEIRALRRGDINLEARVLTVPVEGSKNKYRHRTIRLTTPEVHWAVERLIERARSLGASGPNTYLFPMGVARGLYDAGRPMSDSGMKRVWDEVRTATGLTGFRQYDCRHTAITRMAEAGVPIGVIMSFAGHISPHMTRHYTHISEQSQDTAMEKTQGFRAARPQAPRPIVVESNQSRIQAEVAVQVAAALAGFFANIGGVKVTT